MASRLPGLARRREPGLRALAAALRATAFDRLRADERAWAERVEARRRELIEFPPPGSPEELQVIDFGGAVAWMSMPPVLGRFLLRLVHELAPRSSVEFGTGFGISAAYQAAALELAGVGRLVSIDVVPVWSQIARTGFAELGLMRVEAVVAEDGRAQERLIEAAAPIDYALVDSDHRENATLAALERLAPHLSPGATVVFDDVGFTSVEMQRAWRGVRAHELVRHAVRLGRFGVTVIRDHR